MANEMVFVELAKKYEKLREELDLVREQLNTAMLLVGVDFYAQDPVSSAVYKTYKPNGTFTYYREIDYKRTNLEGEKGGGGTVLSKKEAEEAGFVLGKK